MAEEVEEVDSWEGEELPGEEQAAAIARRARIEAGKKEGRYMVITL